MLQCLFFLLWAAILNYVKFSLQSYYKITTFNEKYNIVSPTLSP